MRETLGYWRGEMEGGGRARGRKGVKESEGYGMDVVFSTLLLNLQGTDKHTVHMQCNYSHAQYSLRVKYIVHVYE